MSQTCAKNCGRPTTGAALCNDCETTFVRQIAELAALADDLRITITRQSVIGSGNGGRRSTETPVPWDDRASRERAALLGFAWRTVLRIWDKHERLPAGQHGGLAGIGRWLHQRINRLLDHHDIGEIANDLHRHTKRASRLIDRPAPGVFAGICSATTPTGPCPTWLYATQGRAVVTCRVCGAHHDVKTRRATLREHAEHILATAAEIARAVVWLGDNVKPDRIRQWASRGRLARHGTDDTGKPLYRIGDVLQLLEDDAQRQQATAS